MVSYGVSTDHNANLSDFVDMRALFCEGRSKELCLSQNLCDEDQYNWCSRSLYSSLEEANVEGKNLNTDVFVSDRVNRGDLILHALEFGTGANSASAQLAVLRAEWVALALTDNFSTFAAQAIRQEATPAATIAAPPADAASASSWSSLLGGRVAQEV